MGAPSPAASPAKSSWGHAGAKAAAGADREAVRVTGQKAIDSGRSVGIGPGPCTRPARAAVAVLASGLGATALDEFYASKAGMVARIGCASRPGERSRGVRDAAAASCALLPVTLADGVAASLCPDSAGSKLPGQEAGGAVRQNGMLMKGWGWA